MICGICDEAEPHGFMRYPFFTIVFCIFFLFFCTANLFAQSPGGVATNLRFWFKANAGVYTDNGVTLAVDNNAVQQWNDQSVVANHSRQTTAGNKPVYRTNVINSNPVLRFSGDQFIDLLAAPGVGPTDGSYMYLVLRHATYTSGGVADGSGTYIIDRTTATSNLMSFKIVSQDKYFYQKRNDGGGSLTGPVSVSYAPTGTFNVVSFFRNVGTTYGINLNGRLDVTSAGDSENITVPVVRIGRHATNAGGGLTGDLAEAILYNANMTNADRLRVESYLAIKYGVTLDQTTATDFVNSSGTVVYPATTTHDLFDVNIAGIARDDGSGLNQTSSQSQNPRSVVRVFSPSSLDNGDFLMWGHDATDLWNSSDAPSGYTNRLARRWRVAETGETGTFSISFDLSSLGVDMTDATKFALLIDANGVFSDATAYTTGRSISGNVVTFTGANLANGDYFSLATSIVTGPGGVAATAIWLRADEGVYNNAGTTLATNGQTVQQWNTTGGSGGSTATQATAGNRPTFVTNVANGNPIVRFATTRYLDFTNLGIGSTSDLASTMVFRPASATGGTITDASGSYMQDRTTATTAQFSLKLLSTGKVGLQERTNSGVIGGPVTTTNVSTSVMQIVDYYRDYNVRFGILYNGAQEGTLAETAGPLTLPVGRIGALQNNANGLDGDIGEYIFYGRDLTTAERNRIDSYLAIKYGITLNQVSLTNYTASDGVVVYPAASTHSGYVADIAGIGRDASSRLVQSSSISANANSVVRIQNPSGLAELEFLIWGDNAGSMTTGSSSVDGTVIKRRLSRVWRVAERGDVGTVDNTFYNKKVPGSKVQADLRMLIDRDGDGFDDNDVAPLTGTLAGQIFTVTGVNLQNNDYFTVGTTNIASTPLPIQLLSFDVELAKGGVAANWRTSAEINNDYFTLERSLDGEKFVEAARVPGAGNSTDVRSYGVFDYPRAKGAIYYRLKQTDFDGKASWSDVRKVNLPEIPFYVSVYPNPVDSDEFHIELPMDTPEASVTILNASGQLIHSGITHQPTSKWNVQDLPAGIYFVKVLTNDGADVVKVVVR